MKTKNTKTTKNTKNTKNTKKEYTNKALESQLILIRKSIKKAREASQEYTANLIYAFLLDSQEYKKTESRIRSILADSFGNDWQAVKGSENRKIRYARIIFESRIEALKNCKNPDEVLHYLKTNQEQLSHSKVLNINTNQASKQASKKAIKQESNQESNQESKSNLYGKNPNPESESMEVIAFIKSAVKNPKLLALMNEKLAESGIRIQCIANPIRKVA